MVETAKIITYSIIRGRRGSLMAAADDPPSYIVDAGYDYLYSLDCGNGLLYTESKRGDGPVTGTESIKEIRSEKIIWTCDYRETVNVSADIAEVLAVLRNGRLRYLDVCIDSIAADCVLEDSGFIYSITSTGTDRSLQQTEKIIYMENVLYIRVSNCTCEVDMPLMP